MFHRNPLARFQTFKAYSVSCSLVCLGVQPLTPATAILGGVGG